ncbi:MAG: hypothetical protein ACFWT4_10910 [Citrobacter braakii]
MPFPGVRLIKPHLACARKINQGQVRFVDLHLSEVAQMVNYGFFGDIDVAVIEASAIAPDGRDLAFQRYWQCTHLAATGEER